MRGVRGLMMVLAAIGVLGGVLFAAAPALALEGFGPLSTFEGGGTPAGSFVPRGIAVDNSAGAFRGDVYVVDTSHNVVDRFSASGIYQAQIVAGFSGPTGVAVDDAGNVYVVDTGNNVVKEFDPVTSLTTPVHEFGTGAGTDALNRPTGVAVDSSGNVYVADTGDNVVKEFNVAEPTKPAVFGERVLSAPKGVAVDPSGNVYVVDVASEVHVFNGLGVAQASLSNPTGSPPDALMVDSSSHEVYAAYDNGIIVSYGSSGNVLAESGPGEISLCETNPFGDGCESGPPSVWGIAVDLATRELYVSNAYLYSQLSTSFAQIVVFQPTVLPDALTRTPASAITATTATVPGEVNPEGTELTGCEFQYGLGASYGQSEPCNQEPSSLTGNALLPVTAHLKGLEPNSIYHYRLVVKTSNGLVSRGGGQTFITPAVPPQIISESTSAVTSGEATLEAQVNPNNEETTYLFEYSAEAVNIGTPTATVVKGATPLSGYGSQSESVATGHVLSLDTTYHYRVIAENVAHEKEAGKIEEFTTVPSPLTGAVTEITATGATFNGTLTPLSAVDAKYSFDYKLVVNGAGCTGENGTTPEPAGTGSGTKVVSTKTSAQSAELQPNAAYSVCLVSSNAFGSEVSLPVGFNTLPAPPKVDGENALVASFAMMLEAQINPNNQETTYIFEYATEGTTGAAPVGTLKGEVTEVAGAKSLSAFGDQTASVSPGVVAPATTYYYRVIAENAQSQAEKKPVEGEVKKFTTPPLPAVSTGEAQDITGGTATLSGTVDPEGAEATYYFAYIDQAGYEKALAGDAQEKANPYAKGETTAPLKVTESGGATYTGTEPQTIPPTLIGGLRPGKTYYYALIAKSVVGTALGSDQILTTPAPTPPVVATEGASAISQNAATIAGTVTTNGLQTNYGFEIGTVVGEYGAATGLGSIGGANTEGVSMTLGELQPATTYYYRVTATNADGTSYGESETFTTPGFPTLLTPQVSPPQIAIPATAFPTDVTESSTPSTKTKAKAKPKTRAQKLTAALKQCHKQPKKSRAKCERQAHAKYGAAKKKK